MNVVVRYFAQLRPTAGRAEQRVSPAGPCTVAALLQHLAESDERLRGALLDGGGAVRASLLVFVNDEQSGPERALQDGDEVTLMTPIAGGRVMAGPLSDEERAIYQWQLDVPGFGEEGQRRLKGASVLVSRVGGVGGTVAYQLAAAGVGRLVLAHAGRLRADDLNRQLLMAHDGVGRPRVELAERRLKELNPRLVVEAVEENVSDANAERLVASADAVASCAPLFAERLAMNRAAVRLGKPLVDCATYELQLQVLTVLPRRSACLACLYPEEPAGWQRRFPVFGAVAGVAACVGAMELIKVLAGLGEPLADRLLLGDLRDGSFRRVKLARRPGCEVCG